MFRILCTVVNRSMGGDANMSSIWPLHNDKKEAAVKPWTEEEMKSIVANANKHFATDPKKRR